MKKILACLGAMSLSMASGLMAISCSSTNMDIKDIDLAILKVANNDLTYEGEYLFNNGKSGPDNDAISGYVYDSVLYNSSQNISSLTKLVTKIFMKELRSQYPKIFKKYPDFSLECSIEKVPEFIDKGNTLQINYSIYYNLHAFDQIKSFTDRSGNPINEKIDVNLDNFTGKGGATRLTEHVVNGGKSRFIFNLKQTKYLSDDQKRLDFISELYTNDTRPIKLDSKQNYQALNMFNVFYIDLSKNSLNSSDFQDEKTVNRVKKIIKNQIDFCLLGNPEKSVHSSLGDLKVIDDVQIKLSNNKYYSNAEILASDFWSKILCTTPSTKDIEQLASYPFLNGIMTLDVALKLKYNKISQKSAYNERLFINFI